jgi:hypothetical protein
MMVIWISQDNQVGPYGYTLDSVEYLENSKEKLKWTLKFMGLQYSSWTAIALANEQPFMIKWKPTKIQNVRYRFHFI